MEEVNASVSSRTLPQFAEVKYRRNQITRCAAPKRYSTPPTAQTPGPIWLIFRLKVSRENTNDGTVAIFEFPPLARDIRG